MAMEFFILMLHKKQKIPPSILLQIWLYFFNILYLQRYRRQKIISTIFLHIVFFSTEETWWFRVYMHKGPRIEGSFLAIIF